MQLIECIWSAEDTHTAEGYTVAKGSSPSRLNVKVSKGSMAKERIHFYLTLVTPPDLSKLQLLALMLQIQTELTRCCKNFKAVGCHNDVEGKTKKEKDTSCSSTWNTHSFSNEDDCFVIGHESQKQYSSIVCCQIQLQVLLPDSNTHFSAVCCRRSSLHTNSSDQANTPSHFTLQVMNIDPLISQWGSLWCRISGGWAIWSTSCFGSFFFLLLSLLGCSLVRSEEDPGAA